MVLVFSVKKVVFFRSPSATVALENDQIWTGGDAQISLNPESQKQLINIFIYLSRP